MGVAVICTPITDWTLDSLLLAHTGTQRTPGLHLSDIIKTIQQDVDPRRYGAAGSKQDIDETTLLRFEAGFTFEHILETAFTHRRSDIFRIGEVEMDGVMCSPDGLAIAGEPPVLEEFKWTWKSTKGTPWPCAAHATVLGPDCTACVHGWDRKHMWWPMQMKGYCHALGIRHARLRVLFVNGDYKTMAPTMRSWAFEFTVQELQDNWNFLLRQAQEKGLR